MNSSESHCTVVRGGIAGEHTECTCGWRSRATSFFGDGDALATWHRLSVGETIDNAYLHAFLAPVTEAEGKAFGYGSGPHAVAARELFAARLRRDQLAAEYAWAIPTESVMRRLAELSPICDLGCGTGYWARLLTDVGATVLAVDLHPPLEGNNHWHRHEAGLTRQRIALRHFTDVVKGDATTFDVPADHALMLCWPPYDDDMAARALTRYQGDRVIYVGEGAGGCTGNDAFHAALAEQWDPIAHYEIPQWDGIHDGVHVYARKATMSTPPTHHKEI